MGIEKGFTIVELLVAMAIGLLVMTSIYSVYYSQQKSYVAQEQVLAMQQNLRAGMTMLTRDIRMAGYDPTGNAGAGILAAAAGSLQVTMDLTEDGGLGGTNENVTYLHYDSDADGTNDALGRDTGGGSQMVAENIDALRFDYFDSNGAATAVPANIRSVQVTMVARTGRGDPGYVDDDVYANQSGVTIFGPANDSNRRRLLSRQIKCRNMGL